MSCWRTCPKKKLLGVECGCWITDLFTEQILQWQPVISVWEVTATTHRLIGMSVLAAVIPSPVSKHKCCSCPCLWVCQLEHGRGLFCCLVAGSKAAGGAVTLLPNLLHLARCCPKVRCCASGESQWASTELSWACQRQPWLLLHFRALLCLFLCSCVYGSFCVQSANRVCLTQDLISTQRSECRNSCWAQPWCTPHTLLAEQLAVTLGGRRR